MSLSSLIVLPPSLSHVSFSSPLALLSSGSYSDVLTLLLQLCIFGTFFGHGCLALQANNSVWFGYLRFVGIGLSFARSTLLLIGALDVLCAFAALFTKHFMALYAWCFLWGFSTALMRPFTGESPYQFIERSGNFLPSLILLYHALHHAGHNTSAQQANEEFGAYLRVIALVLVSGSVVCAVLRASKLLLSAQDVAQLKPKKQ